MTHRTLALAHRVQGIVSFSLVGQRNFCSGQRSQAERLEVGKQDVEATLEDIMLYHARTNETVRGAQGFHDAL